jgi:hypothetical protein
MMAEQEQFHVEQCVTGKWERLPSAGARYFLTLEEACSFMSRRDAEESFLPVVEKTPRRVMNAVGICVAIGRHHPDRIRTRGESHDLGRLVSPAPSTRYPVFYTVQRLDAPGPVERGEAIPCRHFDYGAALREARRLAVDIGGKFAVMKAMVIVTFEEHQVTTIGDEEIPF